MHFLNIKEIHLVITSSQYLIKAVKLRDEMRDLINFVLAAFLLVVVAVKRDLKFH